MLAAVSCSAAACCSVREDSSVFPCEISSAASATDADEILNLRHQTAQLACIPSSRASRLVVSLRRSVTGAVMSAGGDAGSQRLRLGWLAAQLTHQAPADNQAARDRRQYGQQHKDNQHRPGPGNRFTGFTDRVHGLLFLKCR